MNYGIGSSYGGNVDMFDEFVQNRVVCIGWPPNDATAIHQMFAGISVGDLIFIKSFPPSRGLYIKAVGIVKNHEVIDFTDIPSLRQLGYGREVGWIWHDNDNPVHLGRLEDRYDYMRGGSLFQEFGPEVQRHVIDIVLNGHPAAENGN